MIRSRGLPKSAEHLALHLASRLAKHVNGTRPAHAVDAQVGLAPPFAESCGVATAESEDQSSCERPTLRAASRELGGVSQPGGTFAWPGRASSASPASVKQRESSSAMAPTTSSGVE